jgi:hypothetical protein
MTKQKKHVLNAAKKKISDDLLSDYQEAAKELDDLLAEYNESSDDTLLISIDNARKNAEQAHQKIVDWKQKPRAKKKKSVEWSASYDASSRPQSRVVLTEAFGDFKATTAASKIPVATWLEEGSLVCKRGQNKAMIVLSVNSESSQLLNDGSIEYHRNLSLRPFVIED